MNKENNQEQNPKSLVDRYLINQMARIILTNADTVYRCCLVGDRAPIVERCYNRITKPIIGDLVAEISRLDKWEYHAVDSLGRLIDIAQEPIDDDTDETGYQKVFYIETLDGRLMRWFNAKFITVFEDIRSIDDEDLEIVQVSPSLTLKREGWAKEAKRIHGL